MRVLVTGGSSVVGHYLLPRLSAAAHEVTVLSRRRHDASSGIAWRQLDAARAPVWDGTLAGTEALIHLAPLTLLGRVLKDAPSSLRRIVAIGTTSVYTKRESPSDRDRELVRQQRAAEEALEAFCRQRSIVYTLFRPTLVYDGQRDKNVARIARIVRRVGFFPVAAPGRGLRQPLHADDLAAMCIAALAAPVSRAYTLAGGEVLSYRTMLERIFQAAGRRPRILPLPLGVYHAAIRVARVLPRFRGLTPEVADRMNQDMVFDYAAAAQELAFKPRAFAPQVRP